ncbi:50S ribosomal protein L29 [Candidatus Woesearchaeota archaeon CG11_big_fil_rev_8_21_14_0_20_43_8]|nr:MAG: 50S ribosomal protein L29 [Candidatus Woesearchaeota archaeon CG11_big_fil_rev_8_21_14_0_20_43_8]
MKSTKKDLKGLGIEALDVRLKEVYGELMKISAQTASGANPKNLHAIKDMKKTIARINTLKKAKGGL